MVKNSNAARRPRHADVCLSAHWMEDACLCAHWPEASCLSKTKTKTATLTFNKDKDTQIETHTQTGEVDQARKGKHEPCEAPFSINSEPIVSSSIALKSRASDAIVQHTNKEGKGKTGKQKGDTWGIPLLGSRRRLTPLLD